MAGSTWPALTAGARAKASEVEAKFDWVEQDFVPMSGGTKADNTYDLGTAAFRWRNGYFGPGSAGTPGIALRSSNLGIFSASISTFNIAVSGTSVCQFDNSGFATLPNQSGFAAYNSLNTTISTLSPFTFNNKLFDRGNVYTTTTNRFIPVVSGIYSIGYSLSFWPENTTTGIASVDLQIGASSYRSSTYFSLPAVGATSTTGILISGHSYFDISAGATCGVYNPNGTLRWIQKGAANDCLFYAFKVA